MVYNGYYKVMSNIPKMGQLPTPGIYYVDIKKLSSLESRCAEARPFRLVQIIAQGTEHLGEKLCDEATMWGSEL